MGVQRGRITYTATQATPARSPYHAAAFYLLPSPYAAETAIGDRVDLYLDWAYDVNTPAYKDDRTFADASSGIVEVRHFLSATNYKLKLSEIEEAYNTEYCLNGTFDADILWAKGVGWSISSDDRVAACDGTQAGASDLTNSGVVVPGTVKIEMTLSGVTAGTITPIIGGIAGTARSADGTFSEEIVAVGTSIVLQADASFVGNVDDVSVKTVDVVSDFAVMNALNEEIAKGTIMTWWPDWDARPSDYFSVVGNKRIAPRRLRSQYMWAFDLDLRIVPEIQFPSTVPPFVAA